MAGKTYVVGALSFLVALLMTDMTTSSDKLFTFDLDDFASGQDFDLFVIG